MNQFDDLVNFMFDERNTTMHKVFISYHHRNDEDYKDALIEMNEQYSIFVDRSVDTGGVNDALPDDRILVSSHCSIFFGHMADSAGCPARSEAAGGTR